MATVHQTVRQAPQNDPADELQAKFARGLGDATRLRIVRFLLDGPRPVGEIVAFLEMPQSRVSNHLACLKWCGYVATERQGRSVIYRIVDERVRTMVTLMRAIVADHATELASCVRIGDD